VTSSDQRADTPSPTPSVVALALLASLALAGIAAAGPAGAVAESGTGGAATADAGSAAPQVATARSNGTETVALDVERVRNCGDRCRRVTANVTNNGTEPLRNVTAETRIYAAGDRIWTRTHRFRTLSVNASAERTARIELTPSELFRVVRNDGRVRIETTVRWDGGNATFTERRRVLG